MTYLGEYKLIKQRNFILQYINFSKKYSLYLFLSISLVLRSLCLLVLLFMGLLLPDINQDFPKEEDDVETRTHPNLPFFNFRTITAATNNFAPENKIGQGGFGSVYKVFLMQLLFVI